jgi:hypothetical protein
MHLAERSALARWGRIIVANPAMPIVAPLQPSRHHVKVIRQRDRCVGIGPSLQGVRTAQQSHDSGMFAIKRWRKQFRTKPIHAQHHHMVD